MGLSPYFDRQGIRGVVIVLQELVSREAMSSQTCACKYDSWKDPNAVVDEVDLRYAFNLPVSPVSLPPVREAGSYRLSALKQGKAKLRSSLLVSIEIPVVFPRKSREYFAG